MPVRYITAATAAALDARLFSLYPLPQLMELAGAAVAFAAAKTFPLPAHRTVVVVCGPGNNGGDGLVAARHLHAFGYAPTVVVPRVGEGHCAALLSQLRALNVPCVPSLGAADFSCFSFVVDAVFGFSFCGPQLKEPHASLFAAMAAPGAPPVFSVDVPSG